MPQSDFQGDVVVPAAAPGGLEALRAIAYGDSPRPGEDMLSQSPIDPSTKWLAYSAGALRPGNFDQSMQGALGALAGEQSKESELKAKYLPLVAQALMQRQQMQLQMAMNQYKLTQDWEGALTGQLTGLLSKQGDITPEDVVGAISGPVRNGTVPQQFAQQFAQGLPVHDPAALRDTIRRRAVATMNPEKRVEAVSPNVEMSNTGGALTPVNKNPNAAVPLGALPGSVPMSLKPEDRVPKTVETPRGPVTASPTTGKAAPLGSPEGIAITQEALGGGAGAAPQPVLPATGGPTAPAGLPMPPAGAGVPAQSAPSVSQARSPAQLKYEENAGTDTAKYESNLNDRVDAMRDLSVRINEMRDQMKNFQPGAAANYRLKLGSWGKDLGAYVGMSPEKAAAFGDKLAGGNISSMQDFQKVAVTGAMEALRSAMQSGRITQGEFAVFQKNNPSIEMDPDALDKVTNFLTKQYQTASAEQQELGKYKATGADVTGFREYWNRKAQELGHAAPAVATGQGRGSVKPAVTQRVGTSLGGHKIVMNPTTHQWEYEE